MAERVLSTRELNRAMLARQLLLERSEKSVIRAMERMAGLQTQYAPSGYIGLWSRMRDFRRRSLTAAVERGRAVTGTLMRITIHTVSARDYRLFTEGVRRSRRQAWMRLQRHEVTERDMEAVARLLRRSLVGGPQRADELAVRVQAAGYPRTAWTGAGLWLDMVRVPPSGTWERRKADLYGLAEDAIGPWTAGEEQGMEHLVRRYLGGFGPAPLTDVANWAGLNVTTLRPVVERMRVRRFRDEDGGELLDVPGAPLPDGNASAPVRFLPTWDATLLAHARRTQILPEEYRSLIFSSKTPRARPTFVVDGTVAGAWRYEGGRIRLEPFDTLPVRTRRELEDEARALAAFHAEG